METTLTRDAIANYAPEIQTLARTIAARFRNATGTEQGFTIDWEGRDVNPRNALVVGGVVRTLTFGGWINTEEGTLAIAQWLAKNWSHKAYAPIGAWLDDDKTVYLDLVTVLPLKENYGELGDYYMAHNLAAARGELAYGEFDASGNYATTHTL